MKEPPSADSGPASSIADRRLRGRRSVAIRGFVAGLIHFLLFGLAFPPFDLWPLAFIALLPLALHGLRTRRPGVSFLSVWLAGVVGYLWLERWISGITLVGYPLMCMVLALYPATFVWILSRIRPVGRRPKIPGILNVILVPIVWTALEFLRGEILFGGYAWFLLAHPAIGWPALAQSADLLGTYFISFLMAAPAGALADALTLPIMHAGRITRTIKVSSGILLALYATNLIYGLYQLNIAPTKDDPGTQTFTMIAVQTNVPQSNKMRWTNQQQLEDFREFLSLTIDGIEHARTGERTVELIAWPETMAPGYVFNEEAARTVQQFEQTTGYSSSGLPNIPGVYYHEILKRLADEADAPILVGATMLTDLSLELEERTNEEGQPETWINRQYDRHYNSTVIYRPDDPSIETRYDKLHLTPFGEIMPYIHYWPWLQDRLLAIGAAGMSFDLSAGTAPVRFTIPSADGSLDEPIVVATPICFESTVASVCRRLVLPDPDSSAPGTSQRSDVLINLTNDGWFGSHRGGRWQHLQIARFRCIENRVPMVRCANTGISASIDSAGRLVDVGPNVPPEASPQFSGGALLTTIVLDGRLTVFQRVGGSFGWALLTLTALVLVVSLRRCRGERTRSSEQR